MDCSRSRLKAAETQPRPSQVTTEGFAGYWGIALLCELYSQMVHSAVRTHTQSPPNLGGGPSVSLAVESIVSISSLGSWTNPWGFDTTLWKSCNHLEQRPRLSLLSCYEKNIYWFTSKMSLCFPCDLMVSHSGHLPPVNG